MSGSYGDIIGLSHHVSETRARMSMVDRAAQFSPFAALTGFEEAVEETARQTSQRIELEADAQAELDRKLSQLGERLAERPMVTVTCFEADLWKAGGAYRKISGRAERIDSQEQWLGLEGGCRICFEDIMALEGDVFHTLEDG